MINANRLPIPGLLWGTYPERRGKNYPIKARTLAWVNMLFDPIVVLEKHRVQRFVAKVRANEAIFSALNAEQVKLEVHKMQIALRRDGFIDQHVASIFALVNQTCARVLNVNLFDTQIIAAHHILNNRLAEMATGEGKTFAVALAAVTTALAGVPVHVITANDYLAQRDADLLRKFYSDLGITVDAAVQGQDHARRRSAYACDITYCTAKELVFDYLRDGMQRSHNSLRWSAEQISGVLTQPVLLRGLCMAIVDEADSILIDEASVPLILSQGVISGQEEKYIEQSLELARTLKKGQDFRLEPHAFRAVLTQFGREKLEEAASNLEPVWRNRMHREETICQALAGLYIYQRDHHYLVHDGEVHIIDETTGRVAQGRVWSRGLHQVIELKEGCKPSVALTTISQITYQRLFPRYLRLGGVSGTLHESRGELFKLYGLRVSRVPLRLPNKREVFSTRLFQDHAQLRDALAIRIEEIKNTGRSVLVGTESVADSELLSKKLTEVGVSHTVLNARNDKDEAEAIAKAGQAGSVIVTTNMAGRGTDISLEKCVKEQGGLHIISCQINASRRIDRQLAGRSARQGDAGSVETWVSLQTSLLQKKLPKWLKVFAEKYAQSLPSSLLKNVITLIQIIEERHHLMQRKRLLASDKEVESHMTFGGLHE